MKSCFARRVWPFAVLIVGLMAVLYGAASGEAQERRSLVVKGSDTMVHLITALAEVAMEQAKDLDISVTGGGSGTGIAALLNRTTDIASASRELQEKERQAAEQAGLAPVSTTIALDGVAIIVHPSNPVNELGLDDLRRIFTGAADDWKEFGAPAGKILVLSRESSSGTYLFFQEHVLQKADYSPEARLMPATSGIVQAVESDKTAIGYVGLGYAKEAGNRVKVLKVRAKSGEVVVPSEQTVRAGSYPIARPLYLITPGAPQSVAKEFIDFCLAPDGQKLVSELGYVSLRER